MIGPRENVTGVPDGAIVRSDGTAARMAVILTDDPFGASGIQTVGSLEQKLPSLLAASGLADVRVSIGGDTALAKETVDAVSSDFVRIAVVALAANFLLILLFLRAPLAALYLLGASALGLATALGAMELFLQRGLDHPEVVYYVPLVVAVLLLAFGSDYTIFVTGRIWQEAKRRPLAEALAVGQSTTTGPVTIAGLALAASFGLLALVQVGTFRELAFGLAVGVLADAFIVRTLLVPSLISTFGEAGRWPRTSFEEMEAEQKEEQEEKEAAVIPGTRSFAELHAEAEAREATEDPENEAAENGRGAAADRTDAPATISGTRSFAEAAEAAAGAEDRAAGEPRRADDDADADASDGARDPARDAERPRAPGADRTTEPRPGGPADRSSGVIDPTGRRGTRDEDPGRPPAGPPGTGPGEAEAAPAPASPIPAPDGREHPVVVVRASGDEAPAGNGEPPDRSGGVIDPTGRPGTGDEDPGRPPPGPPGTGPGEAEAPPAPASPIPAPDGREHPVVVVRASGDGPRRDRRATVRRRRHDTGRAALRRRRRGSSPGASHPVAGRPGSGT